MLKFLAGLFQKKGKAGGTDESTQTDEKDYKEYSQFLLNELEQLKKETSAMLEEKEEKLRRTQEELMELQINGSGPGPQMSTDTRKAAEKTIQSAKEEAERITARAKMERLMLQKKMEAETSEHLEKDRKSLDQAKREFLKYLDILNESQEKLKEAHEALGALIAKLPATLESLTDYETLEFFLETVQEPEKTCEDVPEDKKETHL